MSASLFLPCKWGCRYHFSSFHIYALIDDICLSLSDLLHSVWQTLGPSMSLQMTQFMLHLNPSLPASTFPGVDLSGLKWKGCEQPSFRIPAFGELLPPREFFKICIWPSAEKTTLATPNAYGVRDSWSLWIPSVGPRGSWICPQGPLLQ